LIFILFRQILAFAINSPLLHYLPLSLIIDFLIRFSFIATLITITFQSHCHFSAAIHANTPR